MQEPAGRDGSGPGWWASSRLRRAHPSDTCHLIRLRGATDHRRGDGAGCVHLPTRPWHGHGDPPFPRTRPVAGRAPPVWPCAGARWPGSGAACRPGARPARSERGRQDHRDRPAAGPAASAGGAGGPVRPAAAGPGRAPPRRGDAADGGRAGHAEGARADRPDPQLLPAPAQRRRLHGVGRAGRADGPPLRPAVRRTAAARAVRAGPLRTARVAVPRRTHHRPGHRCAADAVEGDPRTGCAGLRGAVDHALPG